MSEFTVTKEIGIFKQCLFFCLMWWAGIRPQAEIPLADTSRLTRLYLFYILYNPIVNNNIQIRIKFSFYAVHWIPG